MNGGVISRTISRRHMARRKTLDDVEQRPRRHLVGVGVRSLDMLLNIRSDLPQQPRESRIMQNARQELVGFVFLCVRPISSCRNQLLSELATCQQEFPQNARGIELWLKCTRID